MARQTQKLEQKRTSGATCKTSNLLTTQSARARVMSASTVTVEIFTATRCAEELRVPRN